MDQLIPADSPYLPPASRLDAGEAYVPGWRGLGISSQLAILVNALELALLLGICVFIAIAFGLGEASFFMLVAGVLSLPPASGIAGLWAGRRHAWLRVISLTLNVIWLGAVGYHLYGEATFTVRKLAFWIQCLAALPPGAILAAHLAAFRLTPAIRREAD